MEGTIIHGWCHSVIEDYNNHPLNKSEKSKFFSLYTSLNKNSIKYLYGTTLLYACLFKNCWFISQIGDGRAVCIDMNDNITDPIINDDRLHCGVTTSICSTEAGNDFRHTFGKGDIKSIVIATDGLTDSYLQDSYAKFILTINKNYHKNTDKTIQAVKNWLPIVSERGSRDDISIGFISKKLSNSK